MNRCSIIVTAHKWNMHPHKYFVTLWQHEKWVKIKLLKRGNFERHEFFYQFNMTKIFNWWSAFSKWSNKLIAGQHWEINQQIRRYALCRNVCLRYHFCFTSPVASSNVLLVYILSFTTWDVTEYHKHHWKRCTEVSSNVIHPTLSDWSKL